MHSPALSETMFLLVALLCVAMHISSLSAYKLCWNSNCGWRRSFLKASPSDFSVGMVLDIDDSPCKIMEYSHIKNARAAALIKTKMKNLLTQSISERTFRPGETIPECDISQIDVEFSHSQGGDLVFVDEDDEEYIAPSSLLTHPELLTEDTECTLVMWDDKIIDIELPDRLEFEVNDVRDSGGTRTGTLSCGLDVWIPSFIKIGEKIVIWTKDLKYFGRAERFS